MAVFFTIKSCERKTSTTLNTSKGQESIQSFKPSRARTAQARRRGSEDLSTGAVMFGACGLWKRSSGYVHIFGGLNARGRTCTDCEQHSGADFTSSPSAFSSVSMASLLAIFVS